MMRSAVLATAAMILTMLGGAAQAQDTRALWGARKAATCPDVRKPPTAALAAALVRCGKDRQSTSSGESWLAEDVKVQIGGPTKFAAMFRSISMPDADTRKQVYPIRGSWTWSICILRKDAGIYGNPDLNCRETPVTGATGACWQTTFGDWKCTMNGTSGETRTELRPR